MQCDVVQCNGGCADISDQCNSGFKGRAPSQNEESILLAATTVFVLDPADAPRKHLIYLLNLYKEINAKIKNRKLVHL